jgi:putative endonuclease
MYYTYILKCSDDSFYTWITTDIDRRLNEHNWILLWWAKYTRNRRPVELVYFEEFENRSLATKREIEIKKMTKKNKIILINNIKDD